MKRRGLLQGAAALTAFAALGAARGLCAQEAPAFEALEFDWLDAARQRPVPVRLYLPHAATPEQPAPLVVFSHGIGGSRRGYSWLGQHLAAHGVASLHPQHVGSDRALWRGDLFSIVSRLQDAAQADEALARVHDLRFALDTLLDSALAPRLDARRMAAAGHSYGANTTLLASGARVQAAGQTLALADARLRAAIVMSAPPFYGQADLRPILAGVTLPTLHVTATEDVIRIPGYHSGFEDRLAVFEATASARKWLAVFEGGSHSIFTDRTGTGGAQRNPRVKQATRELVLAFLSQVWDGQGAALAQWPERHAELLARYTPAAA